MTLIELAKIIKKEARLRRMVVPGNNQNAPIWQYNFWQVQVDDSWFARFMRYRNIPITKRLSLYSVFGDRDIIRHDKRDVKIFVTGENVHFGNFKVYSDNMLADSEIDLALGFDCFDDERYLRFPLWLRTQFKPEWTEKEIIQRVQELRYPKVGERNRFASLISRYDWGGTRSAIYNELQHIGEIGCPSAVLHNDDSLAFEFGDDKEAYMRQFYFNICPENSNAYGYVTEKIFDAIHAGCAPIYWGSFNNPEPDILNAEAIVFWNNGGENRATINKISVLMHDKYAMSDFMHQPRLKQGAEEVILDYFRKLEIRLRNIL